MLVERKLLMRAFYTRLSLTDKREWFVKLVLFML